MIQDFHSELLTSEVTESMRNNSLILNVLSKGLQCASLVVLLSDWEFSTTMVVFTHLETQHHPESAQQVLPTVSANPWSTNWILLSWNTWDQAHFRWKILKGLHGCNPHLSMKFIKFPTHLRHELAQYVRCAYDLSASVMRSWRQVWGSSAGPSVTWRQDWDSSAEPSVTWQLWGSSAEPSGFGLGTLLGSDEILEWRCSPWTASLAWPQAETSRIKLSCLDEQDYTTQHYLCLSCDNSSHPGVFCLHTLK